MADRMYPEADVRQFYNCLCVSLERELSSTCSALGGGNPSSPGPTQGLVTEPGGIFQ